MADSNVTVANLTAAPGVGDLAWQWTYVDPNIGGLPYRQLDAVELWVSQTNDRATSSKVSEGRDGAGQPSLVEGAIWFGWIKPRDREGSYGDWYPSSATAGVQAQVGYSAAFALNRLFWR